MSNIQYPNRILNKEGLSYLWTKIKSALSGKADKASNATDGNFASLGANGNLKDSGHKHSDYAEKTNTILETTLSRGRKENTTVGTGSFAFGYDVTASGYYSHAEGSNTLASGSNAHAEGSSATAFEDHSHAEGLRTTASDVVAHAEGMDTIASGVASHAEGSGTTASGAYSHAEGESGTASGAASHVEGTASYATGSYAHAEGRQTTSSGVGAHSEGKGTNAAGNYSHAEGEQTTAYAQSSHVVGRYNSTDTYVNWNNWVSGTEYVVGDKVQRMENNKRTGYVCKTANSDVDFDSSKWDKDTLMNYVELVGNGKNTNNKSNARAVDWDGNEYLKGNLYVNSNADSTGGTMVSTVDNLAIVQNGNTASVNIESGKYVCFKRALCVTTSAITTGETLEIGTNLSLVDNGGLNAINDRYSWKKATWTAWYPSSTTTNFHEVSMPELANAKEIIGFLGSSGGAFLTSIYMPIFGEARSIFSNELAIKLFASGDEGYNYSVGLRIDKTTNKLGYRQTYKGTSASYIGLIEVWYR